MRLPEEVWEAVREYLRASGRLEGMEAGKHIFAPLAEPGKEDTGGRAEDWVEERCLSTRQILANLKLYGRRAGIAEKKLTLMALRRTAIRLKLDEGQAVKEMQIFMDSQEDSRFTKYRLKKLPELPQGQRMINLDDTDGGQRKEEGQVPVRKAKPFRLGENVKHGVYARGKDMEAVKAVMTENIQGLDEEITCLRRLMRGLLEREGNEARVMQAYSGAAQRLRELVTTKQQVQEKKEDTWAEEFLSRIDEIEVRNGRLPISQRVREDALGSEAELLVGSRLMTEEVATIRLLLRNTYRQVAEEQDMAEYLRLVDLYGAGCVRLARMLRFNCDENDQLKRYLNGMIDEAIKEVNMEWKLEKE